MYMRSFAFVLVSVLMLLQLGGHPTPGTAAGLQDNKEKQQAEKAEKQRKEQEQKAAEKAANEKAEVKALMDEVQPDLDALGVEMARTLYEDRFLQDYVNEMGQSLVPKEVPPGVLFSFRVVDDIIPNAFALSDGRIYVTTGLLVFVENEAQLAMVLGHEIGHVTQKHYLEALKDSRSFKKTVLPTLLGGAIGAAVGGLAKGKEGAAAGAGVGLAAGAIVSKIAMNSYSRKQEDEADRVGVRLALDRKFDVKESIAFFQKLTGAFGDQDRLSNSIWGNHSRNEDRIKNIQALLDGDLASSFNSLRTAGELSQGSGQMFLYTSRMFRDVAIGHMDVSDRYDLAKSLLDSIVDYRGRDPQTLWAIGRVYKLIGRTDADRAKALDYLQRAVAADERGLFPMVHRDLGLMQARLGPSQVPAAVESLKKYVVGHVTRHSAYPDDLLEMYDYLLIFGDSKWLAPRVDPMVVATINPAAAPTTPVPTPLQAPPVAPAAIAPAPAVLPPTQPAQSSPTRTPAPPAAPQRGR